MMWVPKALFPLSLIWLKINHLTEIFLDLRRKRLPQRTTHCSQYIRPIRNSKPRLLQSHPDSQQNNEGLPQSRPMADAGSPGYPWRSRYIPSLAQGWNPCVPYCHCGQNCGISKNGLSQDRFIIPFTRPPCPREWFHGWNFNYGCVSRSLPRDTC